MASSSAEAPRRTRANCRRGVWGGAGAALGLGAAMAWLWGFTVDDALITCRVAFHLAGPQGYQVYTSNIDGSDRTKVAAAPGHLFFGTQWSPDGQWVLYVDCVPQQDPGHDCIALPAFQLSLS